MELTGVLLRVLRGAELLWFQLNLRRSINGGWLTKRK